MKVKANEGNSVREHRGIAWIGAGIAALAAYGFVATFQDDPDVGRNPAADGGIFVSGSRPPLRVAVDNASTSAVIIGRWR